MTTSCYGEGDGQTKNLEDGEERGAIGKKVEKAAYIIVTQAFPFALGPFEVTISTS